MPNLQQRGAAMLARRQKQAAGVEITLTRPEGSVTLTAWSGQSKPVVKESQDGPVSVGMGDRDWLLVAAELVLNGSPVEPRVGDRITVAGDTANAWDVYAPPGDKPWRWSDQATRTIMRVHTIEKRVG